MTLSDRQGRTVRNLRVSVTDRCNFRCSYCMPEEGLDWLPRRQILSYEEITRFVRIAIGLGVRKVRLTGGEPLLRRDLAVLVRMLADLPGLADLSLTTNGILLAERAEALARAGLRRVNVSLDSLDAATFRRLARRGGLERVLEGLEVAHRYFDGPVKVNTVVLRGVNDAEVVAFASLARRTGFEVRFIEYMPLDAQKDWSPSQPVSGEEIRARIEAVYPLRADASRHASSPSRDWTFADGAPGKIGFIDSVTEPFCEHCDRIRLTADGKLRTCLFATQETDITRPLRGGATDDELAAVIRAAVWAKEPGHKIGQEGFERASRSMSQIGG